MDRGHPVRGGQLLGVGLRSFPRSPCFPQNLLSLSAQGANPGLSLLFLECKSHPPIFCEHLYAGTTPGSRTLAHEAPTPRGWWRSRRGVPSAWHLVHAGEWPSC